MALIYVLEDDNSVRELETYAISGSGYETAGFAEPKSFYAALGKRKPDLLVIDVMLPGEDGLSITKKLRSNPEYRDMPIILVTAKDSEIDYVKGLDCGADDYITKPFSVMIFLSRKKHQVFSFEKEVDLTYKEFEILKYLMLNRGIAVTREQLLNTVWGYDSNSETRTVDSHILTLRKKLGESGSLIETIRNVGYKLGE